MDVFMFSGGHNRTLCRLAALLLAAQGAVMAQNGTWTSTGSGNWRDATNWSGGIVADGSNNTADLSAVDLVADVTNHLDTPRTIGRLKFGDTGTNTPAEWTLDGGGDAANILTLNGSTNQPGITATNRAILRVPLLFAASTCDMDVSNGVTLTVSDNLDASGTTTLRKKGAGVVKVLGRYGSPAAMPASIFERGTVIFSGNTVYSQGISTPNGNGDVNIMADGAAISAGGALEMETVYSTGLFDMRGGSLTAGQIGLARTGNYGANQSLVTIRDGALVTLSSGIATGDKADTGGATSVVLRDGTLNAGNATLLIGIRAGENFFTQLGGTAIGGELRLQWRMNVQTWNFASLCNLNGGSLSLSRVTTGDGTANFDVNDAYFNFHGGALKPSANESDFFRTTITGAKAALAPPHVVVWPEGAVIDTDGGIEIAIRQPLAAPVGSGVYASASGGLTVYLSGTNAGSGYVATPLVRIGVLNTARNGATAIANMSDDGSGRGTFKVESITITNPGMNYTNAPAVTVSGGAPVVAATVPPLSVATNLSGGLTKKGPGRLSLTGFNTYTGETAVVEGTLELAQACLADESAVRLDEGVGLVLSFQGVDRIGALYYRGIAQPQGLYGAGALDGTISGAGFLKVTKGPPARGMHFIVR